MKITLLGTGASQGVPVPLCNCNTCTSNNPKNKRLRSSVIIEVNGLSILIDTSIDFRQQALRSNINQIDAVLLTHHHFDHLFGLDDLRNYCTKEVMPFYTSPYVADEVQSRFGYAFNPKNQSLGLVCLSLNLVTTPFVIEKNGAKVEVIPIRIEHGSISIYGYRIGNMAYLTDCKSIPNESFELLQGLEVLFISALKHTPHPAHATIAEILEYIEKIAPKQAYLIHVHHTVSYEEMEGILPKNVAMSFDLMEINC